MMNWAKLEDLLKAAVATAYVVFAVWNYFPPVDQTMMLQVITWVFAILAAVVGVNAVRRLFTNKVLQEQEMVVSANSIPVEKWYDTLKAIASFVFVALGIFGITTPVSEDMVMNLLQALFTIAAAIIGAFATNRLATKKVQMTVSAK